MRDMGERCDTMIVDEDGGIVERHVHESRRLDIEVGWEWYQSSWNVLVICLYSDEGLMRR